MHAIVALLLTLGASEPNLEAALSLPKRIENRLVRADVKPRWLPDGKRLWYRVRTGPESFEYVLIDAETGKRKTAPDAKSLDLPAAAEVRTSSRGSEARRSRRTGEETRITFRNELDGEVELFWMDLAGERVGYGRLGTGEEREQHTFEGHVWLVTRPGGDPIASIEAEAGGLRVLIDGAAERRGREGRSGNRPGPARDGISPDGLWSARIEEGRVVLKNVATGQETCPAIELEAEARFRGPVRWAPDSKACVAVSAVPVPVRRITIVESSPKDQREPKRRELDYVKPGDPLPRPIPVIFRVDEGEPRAIRVATDLFPTPFEPDGNLDIRWAADGGEFSFNYNQRGHQLYRILGVDAKSGAVRTIVEETSPTFIDYTNKTWRHWLDKTDELLWTSERDGWCHLWLYDARHGQPKQQVTRGEWVVREVLQVDAEERTVWFLASGVRPTDDPYSKQLCRVQLDGTGFVQLTQGEGDHRIEFSPDRQFFVATWTRVDQPPVTELRRSRDGSLVCGLEQGDASAMVAAGWTLPERFVAKGRDGKTGIHGVLIRPSHFDPAKVYPVVEEVYAGPHSAFAPKGFGPLLRQHMIAELGFIVVQVDGMGTNHRGKAFHDVCWKNLKDAGFPDRIAWVRAAAETRPWMDLKRVGIYGGSAGGQTAMRALLDHSDFYSVAVADCGCHDNRMDKIWWNEQWMGWPVDESYAKSSNVDDAARLQGRLLLIVGELDENVDPASTTQVVGALQRAGKSFDFMPIVGTGHGAAETPFGSRLRMEFLVRHLQP